MPDEVAKDALLSEFIARTGSEPAFAYDLLNGKQWDLDESLKAYIELADLNDDQLSQVLNFPRNCISVPGATKSSNVSLAADVSKLPPPMHRGISRVEGNQNIVKKMQKRNRHNSGGESSLNSTISDKSLEGAAGSQGAVGAGSSGGTLGPFPDACYSVTIPDLSLYHDKGLRDYLERELVEKSTLIALQESGRLNWWTQNRAAQPLYPMVTTGDGNCLLHAASLAMWGFHDRELVLRKALYAPLRNASISLQPFKRRWRFSQTLINQQSGLIWSNEEWEREWESLLQMASYEPRRSNATTSANNNRVSSNDTDVSAEQAHDRSGHGGTSNNSQSCCSGNPPPLTTLERQSKAASGSEDSMGSEQYESLEEFHVFLLANILRRPVIVVADLFLRDNRGENFAPIPFGGVYLPLECNSNYCHRYPLLLTYDAAHFSALVPMEPFTANNQHQNLRGVGGVAGTEDGTTDKCRNSCHTPVVIPVTDSNGDLLPVHFTTDPGPDFDWNLMENVEYVRENQLSAVEQLVLLHKYLVIEVFSLSGWPLFINKEDGSESSTGFSNEGDQLTKSKKSSPRSRKIPSHKFNHSASVDSISSSSKSVASKKTAAAAQISAKDKENSDICDVSAKKDAKSSNLSASNQKLAKKQNSLLGNLSRRFKKCFNPNSSAITSGGESNQEELLTEHSQLSAKVERTMALLSCETDVENDRRFVAAKVDISLKPNYFNEMIRNYLETAQRKYCEELQQMSRRCRSCNEISCSCRVGFRERNSKPQTLPRDMKIDNGSVSGSISSSTSPMTSKHMHNVNLNKSYNRPSYNSGGVNYGANKNARSESTDGGNRMNAYYDSRGGTSKSSVTTTSAYQTRSQVSTGSNTGSSSGGGYSYSSGCHTTASSGASASQVYRSLNYSSSQMSAATHSNQVHGVAGGYSSGGATGSTQSRTGTTQKSYSVSESNNRRKPTSNPTFPPPARVIPSTVITKCRICRRSVEASSICNNCRSSQLATKR